MDKIIARITKLRGRKLNAYNYELTSSLKENGMSVPDDLDDDNINSLDGSNEYEKLTELIGMGNVDSNQVISNQKDTINNTKALLIENYSEALIQKLKLLNSNKTKLRYYYPSGI
jgi:hypothetical protein